MKKLKTFLPFVLALGMIVIFYVCNSLFYQIGYTYFYDYVAYYPVAADAIFCGIMAIIYGGLWFILSKTEFLSQSKSVPVHTKIIAFILSIVVVFGIATIINYWYSWTSEFLTVFAQSSYAESALESYPTETYFWSFLSVVLLGPIMEELLFRGLFQKLLMPVFKTPLIPILVASMSFSLWHGDFAEYSYTIWLGLALGIVYYYSKSLLVVMGMHIFNNFLSQLPDFLQTDVVYSFIDNAMIVCVIPAILILVYMYIKAKPEQLEQNTSNL